MSPKRTVTPHLREFSGRASRGLSPPLRGATVSETDFKGPTLNMWDPQWRVPWEYVPCLSLHTQAQTPASSHPVEDLRSLLSAPILTDDSEDCTWSRAMLRASPTRGAGETPAQSGLPLTCLWGMEQAQKRQRPRVQAPGSVHRVSPELRLGTEQAPATLGRL